eukprot:CAMPEP_0181304932 /NCGR_PEP_ID=MMETSP1101-20121128/9439_1 /TAXON_ID=46948 /ORGANISM="Rhodomonas abbreviata, Strain Caron Lab Isolate" /LENGTH=126 /DNA_ID=CAMNT_0023410773 /DNA_START=99 /DNA_END=475 /DNA_ORIENTATION=+
MTTFFMPVASIALHFSAPLARSCEESRSIFSCSRRKKRPSVSQSEIPPDAINDVSCGGRVSQVSHRRRCEVAAQNCDFGEMFTYGCFFWVEQKKAANLYTQAFVQNTQARALYQESEDTYYRANDA